VRFHDDNGNGTISSGELLSTHDYYIVKPDKEDILEFLRAKEEALSSFGVRTIGLFGSFARDEATTESDIDFLVEYQPGYKTFDNFMGLLLFLEAHFEREIELVAKGSVSEHIWPYITQELVYAEARENKEREEHLIKMMKADAASGLYDS
jgi:uncharacterized protein